ncbi:MAG: hypothetical protein K6T83_14455, partial [Alicyclobacillus sp.]|nr:hypothetical protein [Alicyclobacillus sp.]
MYDFDTALGVMQGGRDLTLTAERPLEELAQFIAEHGNNRLRDPQALAQELKRLAQRAYRLNPTVADAIEIT